MKNFDKKAAIAVTKQISDKFAKHAIGLNASRQKKEKAPLVEYNCLGTSKFGLLGKTFSIEAHNDNGKLLYSGKSECKSLIPTVKVLDHSKKRRWHVKGLLYPKSIVSGDIRIDVLQKDGTVQAKPYGWRIVRDGLLGENSLIIDDEGRLLASFDSRIRIYEGCDESLLIPFYLCISLFELAQDAHREGGGGE